MIEYFQGSDLPDLTLTLRDSLGAVIDLSTGWTFRLRVARRTDAAALFEKTVGFTGAATEPNVTVSWATTGELNTLSAGIYVMQLTATRTSDSKQRFSQFDLRIKPTIGANVEEPEDPATLAAHLTDAVDAHDASAVSFSPTGSIAATDVQAALAELDTEKQPADSDLTLIAALTTTSFGRSLLEVATAAALAALVPAGTFVKPTDTYEYGAAGGEWVLPRLAGSRDNVGALASGALYGSFFTARRTETINNVTAWTGSTAAGATPTLCRIGVWSVDASDNLTALLAATANDTALFAAANTAYTKALTSAFSKVAGTRYFVGILVVSAAAMPSFMGTSGLNAGTAGWTAGAANRPLVAGYWPAGYADLPSSAFSASSSGVARAWQFQLTP